MIQDWVNHCINLCYTESPERKASIKLFRDLCLTFDPGTVKMHMFGYSKDNPYKLNQLRRYYLNQESVDFCKKALDEGKLSSFSVSLRGQRKTYSRSQDFCLQSMIISKNQDDTFRVNVFHRNTEIIKKFGADLVFIQSILDELEIPKVPITFYLCNVSLNAAYYPILIPYQKNWKKTLAKLKKRDYRFYKNVISWCNNHSGPDINFTSLRRVQHSLRDLMGEELHRDFCKHSKEQYNEWKNLS